MKKILITIPLLILFKFLLDYTYVNYVVVVYNEFSLYITPLKVVESYILTIALGLIVVKWFNHLKKPSYIIIYILLLNLFIPLFSYYAMSNSSRAFVYAAIGSFIIIMAFSQIGKPLKLFYLLESKSVLILVVFAIVGIVTLNLVAGGGLSRLSLDLLKVYEVREQYLMNKGFMMGYFLPWTAYSINTILLAYFLYKKKMIPVLVILMFQLFLYATTGFKSYLFAPALVFLIHFALNVRKAKSLLPILTIGFIAAIICSFFLFKINDDIVTASIFIRRNFFVPAQINFLYFEYFSIRPFVYLSDSIFEGIVRNPYGTVTPVLYQVSEFYYGTKFGLNVGYIGNAFMHFGYFGIFVFSVAFGFVLKLIDSISDKLPISVTVASIIIPSMAFVNSGFLTVLVTHGVLMSCLMIWLLNSHVAIKGMKMKKRQEKQLAKKLAQVEKEKQAKAKNQVIY